MNSEVDKSLGMRPHGRLKQRFEENFPFIYSFIIFFLMFDLTILSISHIVQCHMTGSLVNSELEKMWEHLQPHLKYCPDICLEGLRRTTRNFCKGIIVMNQMEKDFCDLD